MFDNEMEPKKDFIDGCQVDYFECKNGVNLYKYKTDKDPAKTVNGPGKLWLLCNADSELPSYNAVYNEDSYEETRKVQCY